MSYQSWLVEISSFWKLYASSTWHQLNLPDELEHLQASQCLHLPHFLPICFLSIPTISGWPKLAIQPQKRGDKWKKHQKDTYFSCTPKTQEKCFNRWQKPTQNPQAPGPSWETCWPATVWSRATSVGMASLEPRPGVDVEQLWLVWFGVFCWWFFRFIFWKMERFEVVWKELWKTCSSMLWNWVRCPTFETPHALVFNGGSAGWMIPGAWRCAEASCWLRTTCRLASAVFVKRYELTHGSTHGFCFMFVKNLVEACTLKFHREFEIVFLDQGENERQNPLGLLTADAQEQSHPRLQLRDGHHHYQSGHRPRLCRRPANRLGVLWVVGDQFIEDFQEGPLQASNLFNEHE